MLDRLLATSAEHGEARERAFRARQTHGDSAETYLAAKLSDPRRRRSRRVIRLALAMLRDDRSRVRTG